MGLGHHVAMVDAYAAYVWPVHMIEVDEAVVATSHGPAVVRIEIAEVVKIEDRSGGFETNSVCIVGYT